MDSHDQGSSAPCLMAMLSAECETRPHGSAVERLRPTRTFRGLAAATSMSEAQLGDALQSDLERIGSAAHTFTREDAVILAPALLAVVALRGSSAERNQRRSAVFLWLLELGWSP